MASEAGELFDDVPEREVREKGAMAAKGAARVLMPNRLQLELRASDLESLLAQGHRARIVWGYVTPFGRRSNISSCAEVSGSRTQATS